MTEKITHKQTEATIAFYSMIGASVTIIIYSLVEVIKNA